jgi:2-polyprenyl-3-methyl-5-hydroxy-6-metoxy-1,4-benzoquinol methylase
MASYATQSEDRTMDTLNIPTSSPIPCPVCFAPFNAHRKLYDKHGFTMRRCACCRLELINPRPTDEWIQKRYQFLSDTYFLHPFKVASDFRAARFDLELSLLEPAHGRLLDVGCADGAFVVAAKGRGYQASGIDIMQSAIEFGRSESGLDLECGDFTDGHLQGDSYDVVTMWATLEHLDQPAAFLDEAQRVLRPGGLLAVSVPNIASLTHRLLRRRDRYVSVEHLNYFSPNVLSTILRRHGLVVETQITRKFNPKTLLQDLLGAGVHERLPVDLLKDQIRTDIIKTSRALGWLRFLHGTIEKGLGSVGLGDCQWATARKL